MIVYTGSGRLILSGKINDRQFKASDSPIQLPSLYKTLYASGNVLLVLDRKLFKRD